MSVHITHYLTDEALREIEEKAFQRGIAQERERCARVAEAEEQECETMRSAYANDAYNWSFWERSRKTASSIAVAIRAGDASE